MADSKATHLRNALDAFTTYSTHFIVMAARTTENARVFMNGTADAQKQTLDAIDRCQALGEVIPITSAANTTGDVFLVMDTRRFSQFTVESMKYDVFINGLSAGQSHANLATTIEMTVLDSVGISFINFLQWLMDSKLQTNFDGMIFLIRTVFVGHKENGETQTVQAMTIPAYLTKMEVNLDYSKGVYSLEFMPNMNFSVFTHNRWLNIGRAASYSTTATKKLGAVVQAFEDRLNKESQEFYNSAQIQILGPGKAPTPGSKGYGRVVKYQITLPEGWADLDFYGSWKHNSNDAEERDFTKELQKLDSAKTPEQKAAPANSTGTPAKSVSTSVPAGILATEVLDIMFKQVPAIAEFANAEKVKQQDGLLKFHKHVVSLTSTDQSVLVHIDVVAFSVPAAAPPSQSSTAASVSQHQAEFYTEVTDDHGTTRSIPKNFFELDYIFTGKNTQVLNFDMKIQDLQFLLATNVKVSEGQMVYEVIENGNEKKTETPEYLNIRAYDPILIPQITDQENKSFAGTSAAARDKAATERVNTDLQAYARNLSAFYAISPIQVQLTLKGNPDIMLKFSSPNMPAHAETSTALQVGQQSTTNQDVRAKYRADFEKTVLKLADEKAFTRGADGVFGLNPQLGTDSYMTTPVFVKVNVKGPNVDFRTNQLIEGQDFATDILSDNYYVVFKVTNIIERGVFTQQLELWSHNVFGNSKLTKEQTGSKAPQQVKS